VTLGKEVRRQISCKADQSVTIRSQIKGKPNFQTLGLGAATENGCLSNVVLQLRYS